MKKLLSLLLVMGVLLSITVPFTAFAETVYTEGNFRYTVSNGEATITNYTGYATYLTIPSSLGGYPVTTIGKGALDYCDSLKSVSIPNSVTTIGDEAFFWCTSLTSVTIPNNVTTIGEWAFSKCYSLTSVTIPNSVTTIGEGAFYACGLTSVTIPDSVTTIGAWAFGCCRSLTSVTIPDSVTTIGDSAFYYCDSLTSVYISDIAAWCAINFETIVSNPLCYGANLYLNGQKVVDLVIPDGVTTIGVGAFYETTYYIDENNWDNGVLYIGKHLISAKDTITGKYTIKAGTKTIADYAFSYCERLT
ncbi:MAG: leucine-rich repeat protein [Clostridia bacterium]|nr:leucine-rich repeat protein [Clostridia bacterium]